MKINSTLSHTRRPDNEFKFKSFPVLLRNDKEIWLFLDYMIGICVSDPNTNAESKIGKVEYYSGLFSKEGDSDNGDYYSLNYNEWSIVPDYEEITLLLQNNNQN